MRLDLRGRHRAAGRTIGMVSHRIRSEGPPRIQGQGGIDGVTRSGRVGGSAAILGCIPTRENRARPRQGAAVGGQSQSHAMILRLRRRHGSAGRAVTVIGHRIADEDPPRIQSGCGVGGIA